MVGAADREYPSTITNMNSIATILHEELIEFERQISEEIQQQEVICNAIFTKIEQMVADVSDDLEVASVEPLVEDLRVFRDEAVHAMERRGLHNSVKVWGQEHKHRQHSSEDRLQLQEDALSVLRSEVHPRSEHASDKGGLHATVRVKED